MAARTAIDALRQLLADAIARRQIPGAVVLVGSSEGTVWQEAFGRLLPEPQSAAVTLGTWYDLASLTKPLATATVIFDLAARGALALDSPISTLLAHWDASERRGITVQDLLEHASGLSPRFANDPPATREAFAELIAVTPLAYPPRSQAIYSDLGFILLALIAEARTGSRLDLLLTRVLEPVVARWPAARDLGFTVPGGALVAPTQPLPEDPRPGPLVGTVHDSYAAALGGIAGHAGLFATASGVGGVATAILRAARGESLDRGAFSTAWIQRATAPSTVPGSSRGLGWDRMLPTSSCGVRLSSIAFGHVGFTGTSLWIDPARDRFYVLLTNRVAGSGTLAQIRDLRRAFHDAAAEL